MNLSSIPIDYRFFAMLTVEKIQYNEDGTLEELKGELVEHASVATITARRRGRLSWSSTGNYRLTNSSL